MSPSSPPALAPNPQTLSLNIGRYMSYAQWIDGFFFLDICTYQKVFNFSRNLNFTRKYLILIVHNSGSFEIMYTSSAWIVIMLCQFNETWTHPHLYSHSKSNLQSQSKSLNNIVLFLVDVLLKPKDMCGPFLGAYNLQSLCN